MNSFLSFARLLMVSLLVAGITKAIPANIERRGISQERFDDFVHYWKYCSATTVSAERCPYPNGSDRVLTVNNVVTDTQAFVARDDERKEIVVSFAATRTPIDVLNDVEFIPVPAPWANAPPGSAIHSGFLLAYNSVKDELLGAIESQVELHPDYSFLAVGHSLGAATVSIMAVTLNQAYPDKVVKLYTYGHPRTFNDVGADWVTKLLGDNSYRVVHYNDPIPLLPPRISGYKHEGTEYWQTSAKPPSLGPDDFKKCDGQEDKTCLLSQAFKNNFFNHIVYMGIEMDVLFCNKD